MRWGQLSLSPRAARSLKYEKLTELTLPGALVLLEGGVVGVIAAKFYAVSPFTLALISAAPMFANLSSFMWSRFSTARPKVAVACALQACIIACVLAVALTPINEFGAIVLVSSMIISRILVAGMITVRSVVWSLNYARNKRARATGQLQMISSLVSVIISSAIGPLLDAFPDSLPLVYLAGAAAGALGILFFSRVEVIGEARQRVQERREARTPETRIGFLAILRTDRRFASYQVNMFLAGFGNMLIEAVLIFVIAREMNASYTTSIMLTMVVPFSVRLISLPLWANYLDRVHVAQFRARQSILWIAAQLLTMLGAMLASVPWLIFARFITGLAWGGGALAWQLGHNDFAKSDQLTAYLGVHVTLTGVRGATAPFVGIYLYLGWQDAPGSFGGGCLGTWDGIGAWVFAVAACISAMSGIGFNRLYRSMKREGSIKL